MSACIYIVDDEENIRELVSCALTSFGYRTECFETAEELLERCGSSVPDLILLDVMLPGISGTAALDILKKNTNTREIPVLLLTARSAETEKVAGLDKGADDYITKPFGILELSARVRAALRRSQTDGGSQKLSCGKVCLDREKHQVTVQDSVCELTLKEYRLLEHLLENCGKAVSREELLEKVWSYEYIGESRTLDMHIKTLRQKLCAQGADAGYITTIRGVGYIIQ